ncbi:ImmA/IrrE family metallo-endopeptidase [bacterium]|nr:ImmA/IrrE family metallo-endopeptidase [bacterium]
MPQHAINIPVKPDVLKWARQSAGKSVQDVAGRLSLALSTVEAWEQGEQTPTLAHVRQLATFLKRPLAAFFLPTPPAEPPVPGDFRRLPEDKAEPFSIKTILAIRRARAIQNAAREFIGESGHRPVQRVGSATTDDDPAALARAARAFLGFSEQTLSRCSSNASAFEARKGALESHGFFVAELPFPLAEARAFSIADTYTPLIVLNHKDSYAGKSFSLFHEYAHLLLGKSGVLDNTRESRLTSEGRRAEQFCNAFAAEFLVQVDTLIHMNVVTQHRAGQAWKDSEIDQVADRFRVSAHVIATRLLTSGRLSDAAYSTLCDHYEKLYEELSKEKHFGKPVPAKTCVRENGRPFVSLVYEAFGNQRISYKEIADCLGIKPKYVDAVSRLLKEHQAA